MDSINPSDFKMNDSDISDDENETSTLISQNEDEFNDQQSQSLQIENLFKKLYSYANCNSAKKGSKVKKTSKTNITMKSLSRCILSLSENIVDLKSSLQDMANEMCSLKSTIQIQNSEIIELKEENNKLKSELASKPILPASIDSNNDEIKTTLGRNSDDLLFLKTEVSKLNDRFQGLESAVVTCNRDSSSQQTDLQPIVDIRLSDLERKMNFGKLLLTGEGIKSMLNTQDYKSAIKNFLSDKLELSWCLPKIEISKFGKHLDRALLFCTDNSILSLLFLKIKTLKPANIFLSELLTPVDSKIAYELRQLKKIGKLCSVSIFHGTVYYKINNYSRRSPIKSITELNKLKEELQHN